MINFASHSGIATTGVTFEHDYESDYEHEHENENLMPERQSRWISFDLGGC